MTSGMKRRAPRLLLALLVALGILWPAGVALAQEGVEGEAEASGEDCERFAKPDAVERNGGEPLGLAVWGRLCQVVDGEPIYPEGVEITVSQDGEEIATGATDEVGFFLIELPESGTYQVTLDESTLPDGIALTDEGSEALEPTVRNDQRLVFRLGEGSTDEDGSARYLIAAGKGLRFGAILAVAAVGLSMVYGVTGLVNFAHAELVTAGAITAYVLDQAGIPFWLSVPLAVALGGLYGWGNDRLLWRPLRR